jgi:hypothetical protein
MLKRKNELLYTFRFTICHDRKITQITTTGVSPQAARRKVVVAEYCPLSAIVREEIQDGQRFVRFI